MIEDAAFSHKIDYVTIFQGIQIALLVQNLWVDFAHWWSFIGKGLNMQPAQQASLLSLLSSKYYLAVNSFIIIERSIGL